MWAKQKGFTIVELLIVIVVIGILAAIVIVAFNGVQNRAENTRINSLVGSYVKALMAYKAENGAYPTVSSCLGTGYQGGFCHADAGMYSENNGNFNTVILKNYLSQVPTVKSKQLPLATKWVDTAFYTWNNASYNPTGASIALAQYGTTSCPSLANLRLLTAPNQIAGDVWCRYALD